MDSFIKNSKIVQEWNNKMSFVKKKKTKAEEAFEAIELLSINNSTKSWWSYKGSGAFGS
jgi:hypothetical protein